MLKNIGLEMKLMSAIQDYIQLKTITESVYQQLCSSLDKEEELQQKYDELNTKQWHYALEIESMLSQITPYFTESYPSEWAIADAISTQYEKLDYHNFLIYLNKLSECPKWTHRVI